MDSSKQHNSPDDSNKPNDPHEAIGADEQRTADETIGMLERESTAEALLSQSQKDTCLIGEAIRTSATAELPEANGDLRELLVVTLERESSNQSDNTEPVVLAKASATGSTDKSSWRSLAAIAATVLAISGLGYVMLAESLQYEAPLAVNNTRGVDKADATDSKYGGGSNDLSRGPANGSNGSGQGSADQSFESILSNMPKSDEDLKPFPQNLSLTVDDSTVRTLRDEPAASALPLTVAPPQSTLIPDGKPAEAAPANSDHSDQSNGAETRQGQQQGDAEQPSRKPKPLPPSNKRNTELSGSEQRGSTTRGGSSNRQDKSTGTPLYPSSPNPSSADVGGQGRGGRGFIAGGGPIGGGGGFGGGDGKLAEGKNGRYRNFDRPSSSIRPGFDIGFHYDLEQYAKINDNPFRKAVGVDAVSTFSIDVDTASYANVRRFINNGQAIPPDAVRIEEMVNYFSYKYAQPIDDKPFSVNMEMATCPWNEQHKLLRVGLKGKEIHQEERPASNIVFLLDVSGSMKSNNKLPLLKSGVQMMVNQLNENDRVSIVTYAGNAGVVLEPTPGNQKQKILDAIRNLNAGGSTNGSAGIELAYQLAQKNFVQEGTNKVILATDGDLNVGVTSDEALVDLITGKAKEGTFLTVLGFGTGNLKDSKLEKLADKGNGIYAYIDGVREAHKVLVEGISGTLVTIAKDVKIQIEFNPNEVKSYRLIGYENRILAREDFDNDAKDAGEIGAGHTVTALYELVTTDVPTQEQVVPKGLKYQQPKAEPAEEAGDSGVDNGELLTLALRFKKPDADKSERIEFTLKNEDKPFSTASKDFKFASSVAAFGMILRSSPHRGDASMNWVTETAEASTGADLSGYRKEFIDLVRRKNRAH